ISHFGNVGSIYGDSRLRITAGQTETAPAVVLGGVDACRWCQDAKAPVRIPLLHAMVDASRLLGHQTHEHMKNMGEKKRIAKVMSKSDGEGDEKRDEPNGEKRTWRS
ncbi:hypothetical protein HID58_013485, partial [Brassica napus]